MKSGDSVPDSIPIGRPISNTQVYILDEHMNPAPPGTVGELYAGGDGVARGYLRDPEASANKFILNPFTKNSGDRIYRTGDLARWRQDGLIEFVGRIDDQTKILGYRVEPGEIEAVLRMHDAIEQVCVVPHTDEHGSKRLVAYYVSSAQAPVSSHELREFLNLRLPHFMVPALFVPLPALPLSRNGKVDRSALPDPTIASKNRASQSDLPTTELEHSIADLWRSTLHTDRLGLDDNFFDLGGDSLLLVTIHSKLQRTLRRGIEIIDLFEFTTVRKLARRLSASQPAEPSLSETQDRAQKQRQAFARQRERRSGGDQ
jgi:acyl carrier protein